jgi:hypothetical protein
MPGFLASLFFCSAEARNESKRINSANDKIDWINFGRTLYKGAPQGVEAKEGFHQHCDCDT